MFLFFVLHGWIPSGQTFYQNLIKIYVKLVRKKTLQSQWKWTMEIKHIRISDKAFFNLQYQTDVIKSNQLDYENTI